MTTLYILYMMVSIMLLKNNDHYREISNPLGDITVISTCNPFGNWIHIEHEPETQETKEDIMFIDECTSYTW